MIQSQQQSPLNPRRARHKLHIFLNGTQEPKYNVEQTNPFSNTVLANSIGRVSATTQTNGKPALVSRLCSKLHTSIIKDLFSLSADQVKNARLPPAAKRPARGTIDSPTASRIAEKIADRVAAKVAKRAVFSLPLGIRSACGVYTPVPALVRAAPPSILRDRSLGSLGNEEGRYCSLGSTVEEKFYNNARVKRMRLRRSSKKQTHSTNAGLAAVCTLSAAKRKRSPTIDKSLNLTKINLPDQKSFLPTQNSRNPDGLLYELVVGPRTGHVSACYTNSPCRPGCADISPEEDALGVSFEDIRFPSLTPIPGKPRGCLRPDPCCMGLRIKRNLLGPLPRRPAKRQCRIVVPSIRRGTKD